MNTTAILAITGNLLGWVLFAGVGWIMWRMFSRLRPHAINPFIHRQGWSHLCDGMGLGTPARTGLSCRWGSGRIGMIQYSLTLRSAFLPEGLYLLPLLPWSQPLLIPYDRFHLVQPPEDAFVHPLLLVEWRIDTTQLMLDQTTSRGILARQKTTFVPNL